MAINPIQTNIDNTKKSYLEAQGAVKVAEYTKPLPPQGHLVHDTLLSVPKFWIKDIAYDIKAVKDGFNGTANDHQTGRLNDVGLKLGGIGIATVLAANTKNPMARTMEYVGLGTFLAAMSLYPKIAINGPSRLVHGFDIGKEYIDDQGRKKSVFQDSNYIPFDMYEGKFPGENLDIIGDRLGIPRDIQNRRDVVKEQMRKIATQNNTLWMLTAGFATPVMTALICSGLEKIIAPAIEKARNYKYDSQIVKALNITEQMTLDVNEIKSNELSESVRIILEKYKGQEIPREEIDKVINLLSGKTDSKISEGIKEDLTRLLRSTKGGFSIPENSLIEIQNSIKTKIPSKNKLVLEKNLIPTENELKEIFDKVNLDSKEITSDEIMNLKGELKKLFAEKIEKETSISNKEYLRAEGRRILDELSVSIKKKPYNTVSDQSLKDIVDFAKVIGEFKQNNNMIDKSKNFKIEYTSETVLARSFSKFENTLLNVLNIGYKDLKILRESTPEAQKLLEEKIEALVKDSAKYEKAITKLAKVIATNDKILGSSSGKGTLKNLIFAFENNYNNTAKRLNSLGKFSSTVEKLVKGDLSHVVASDEDLIKLLDGVLQKDVKEGIEYVKDMAIGVGSSKRDQITKIIDRYQGAGNSFSRMIHTLDYFRRLETLSDQEKFLKNSEYGKEITRRGKDTLLRATSSEHIQKLYTVNNPSLYSDIMNDVYHNIDLSTKNGMNAVNESISKRFETYIKRFKDLFGTNSIDFQKQHHRIGDLSKYSQDAKTRLSHFNLLGQSPVDMVKGAADRRFSNQKWLKVALAIGGTVLGITLLAQFNFGRLKNPQNLKKQVSDDTNS